MNLPNFIAEHYLFEPHESFEILALRWIFTVGGYGFIAVVIGSVVWQVINAAKNKPTTGESPKAPTSQPRGTVRAAGPSTSAGLDSSDNLTGTIPTPASPVRTVPEAGVIPAVAAASVAGPDAAERLQKLNHLRDQGLVSAEIYETKRQQILQAL